MATATLRLFRPVGPSELARIQASGFRAFPPRLSYQPIFYPVLTEAYAGKIARDWNATREDTGFRGFVTQFDVDAAYVARFAVQTVGHPGTGSCGFPPSSSTSSTRTLSCRSR